MEKKEGKLETRKGGGGRDCKTFAAVVVRLLGKGSNTPTSWNIYEKQEPGMTKDSIGCSGTYGRLSEWELSAQQHQVNQS